MKFREIYSTCLIFTPISHRMFWHISAARVRCTTIYSDTAWALGYPTRRLPELTWILHDNDNPGQRPAWSLSLPTKLKSNWATVMEASIFVVLLAHECSRRVRQLEIISTWVENLSIAILFSKPCLSSSTIKKLLIHLLSALYTEETNLLKPDIRTSFSEALSAYVQSIFSD
jgi:hypothetical protein